MSVAFWQRQNYVDNILNDSAGKQFRAWQADARGDRNLLVTTLESGTSSPPVPLTNHRITRIAMPRTEWCTNFAFPGCAVLRLSSYGTDSVTLFMTLVLG
jgi:hypothetical protein